jgi:hypothetical protein
VRSCEADQDLSRISTVFPVPAGMQLQDSNPDHSEVIWDGLLNHRRR